jgi:2-polyprenyl-3-methyl-5-hydroxy-6-metoxy-1,4-benzoquinol methylase
MSETMNYRSMSAEFAWDLTSLPFIWTTLATPSNGGEMPDLLPFSLRIDPGTGTLRQSENPLVSRALEAAYAHGSVLSPMNDGSMIGKSYTEDFLSFVGTGLDRRSLGGTRVLDIGAGAGYLAYRLQGQGADVTGIEPGDHGQEGARKYGVRIIQDYFPTTKITGTFDLITMYAVLEHVQDPVAFLAALKAFRHEHTRLILSVPDCQPCMERGDISVLLHEHWQYFTMASLKNVLQFTDAEAVTMQKACFGGCIYAAVSFDDHQAARLDPEQLAKPVMQAHQFRSRSESFNRRLAGYLGNSKKRSERVGIYIPGRAMNALVSAKIDCSHCRFFDDNENSWGKYFPGMNIPVESRQQLLANHTDRVLIMSLPFGDQIKRELQKELLPHVKITTLAELLDEPQSSVAA